MFIAICSLYEINQYPKRNKLVIGIIIFLLFLVSGFKYETGVDWFAYEYLIDSSYPIDKAFVNGRWDLVFPTLDVGYSFLNSLIKSLGGGIQILIFISSLVSIGLLKKNVEKYSPLPIFSLLVYYTFFFFIFDLSGLRQGLAIQLFFFSLRYLEKKNFLKYILTILLATSVHWTSILLVPMYFILNRKASIRNVVIVIIISTIVFSFQIKWLGVVMGDVLNQINGFTLLAGKVSAYTTNDVFAQNRGWNTYSFYVYIKIILLVILTYQKRNIIIKKEKSQYFNIFFNLSLAQFFCIFTFYEFYEMSERFKFYFLISEVILFPWLIVSFYYRYQKQITLCMCTIFIFFNSYIYFLEFPTSIAYTPYQNYIIYKMLDKKSTGYERLQEHIRLNSDE